MSKENNNKSDYAEKYFKPNSRVIGIFVTDKMAKQISFIAKRRKQSISHFILNAIKYYIEHECSMDWDFSKIYVKEDQIKKGN